eukprot:CAMPEP_0174888740 /NCGR_PEP_ID=MMETSP0167-20121228/4014_1 /TAXON_ID=38298 /ORGANISM="Rhodella maculata, Strain CCMP736" /LENGTH=40 /DNA_ID= /DNA_START= /DNA_END= /DNA_ORIENTATION=
MGGLAGPSGSAGSHEIRPPEALGREGRVGEREEGYAARAP